MTTENNQPITAQDIIKRLRQYEENMKSELALSRMKIRDLITQADQLEHDLFDLQSVIDKIEKASK